MGIDQPQHLLVPQQRVITSKIRMDTEFFSNRVFGGKRKKVVVNDMDEESKNSS